jgi:hypothetical protein
METLEDWDHRIEEREENIRQAFFEYVRDKELPASNTSYFFARQILPTESILLKHCVITCLLDCGDTKIEGDNRIIQK